MKENIDISKVTEQIKFIFSENNKEVIRKVLEACMTNYPRLGENEYETLINNAKVVGQLELLQNMEIYISEVSKLNTIMPN